MNGHTYNVHSVEVGHDPDGTPIAYVTLACTVAEARAAGALLYRDVTLTPVREREVSVAMPGSVTYDLDDPNDWTRFVERLPQRARNVLRRETGWHRAFGKAPPTTLRALLALKRGDVIRVPNLGVGMLRAIREALVEGGLPDLAE